MVAKRTFTENRNRG
jgi:hypothetical protein